MKIEQKKVLGQEFSNPNWSKHSAEIHCEKIIGFGGPCVHRLQ